MGGEETKEDIFLPIISNSTQKSNENHPVHSSLKRDNDLLLFLNYSLESVKDCLNDDRRCFYSCSVCV